MTHLPVLLNEVSRSLNLQPAEYFIDATVNRGGHSRDLCQALDATSRLIGIDADNQALAGAKENLAACPCPVTLVNGNFRRLAEIVDRLTLPRVNAILFDLGFSREQIEESGRGFSFERDEPLLMTFKDRPAPPERTAAEIINQWPENRLREIFEQSGGERFSRRIAKAIVDARRRESILTSGQLVAVVNSAVPSWYRHLGRHSATKVFQALRITTNDELAALAEGLDQAWQKLAPGGRLAVITFHSGEARLVKHFFRQLVREGAASWVGPRVTKPDRAEILLNPSARSAQLRTIKKSIKNHEDSS